MDKELQTSAPTIPQYPVRSQGECLADKLYVQEKSRMGYWGQYDHFIAERMQWRASTMRHIFHILPGQKILEIGAGSGIFTQAMIKVTRNECPVTAVVFSKEDAGRAEKTLQGLNAQVKYMDDFPGPIREEKFDYIVAHHMLGDESRNILLNDVKHLLKPGGAVLFFELNPWNPYYRLRRFIQRLIPIRWRRPAEALSLNHLQILSVFSETGYTHIHATPYDFLYAPVPRRLLWPAKNLSLIMENCPGIRNFAGSIYVWARYAATNAQPRISRDLAEHAEFAGQVSFVIPCHNEEMNVGPLVEGLKNFYGKYIHEIIIVDDNSKDQTYAVAQKLAVEDLRVRVVKRSPPNGVGRALREGIAAAKGEYVLIMDCDFQEIIPELRDLFDALVKGADVVVGSRFSRESVLLNYPFTKIIANRAFHFLANILLGKQFRDLTNNLKIFKRTVAQNITIEFDDFAANAETGLKPLLLGYKVAEVPISWMNRSLVMGFSSFKIMKTGPNYGRLLFRLLGRRLTRRGFGKL